MNEYKKWALSEEPNHSIILPTNGEDITISEGIVCTEEPREPMFIAYEDHMGKS